MIEMGIIVSLGLIITLAKLPWKAKLWVTSHPLTMDITVFVLLNALHWGTFSGLMVAAAGALFTSIVIWCAAKVIGRVEKGTYVRGIMDVSTKLMRA
jgi:hypothetical protein